MSFPPQGTGGTSTLTQADILSDATPFPGANIPAIKAKTDLIGASVSSLSTSDIFQTNDIVIYPVAETAGTTEITDDGSSPAYYADTESGTATLESNPNVHWLEDINFEQSGTITIISIFCELRWENKTSAGTSSSKMQISRDGGSNWIDMTDSITETNTAYQSKTRIGVGQFITTIVAGVNQLQTRLVSWEPAGNTSSAKIRSDTYIRITYRKSA